MVLPCSTLGLLRSLELPLKPMRHFFCLDGVDVITALQKNRSGFQLPRNAPKPFSSNIEQDFPLPSIPHEDRESYALAVLLCIIEFGLSLLILASASARTHHPPVVANQFGA